MIGSARIIWEEFASTGVSPTTQVDTDTRTPPTFEDVVGAVVHKLTIAPAASNTNVVLATASCSFLLVSDEAIVLRLASGETQMRVRRFYVDSDDSEGSALPAQTLLLSGNGTSTANVEIYALAKVS